MQDIFHQFRISFHCYSSVLTHWKQKLKPQELKIIIFEPISHGALELIWSQSLGAHLNNITVDIKKCSYEQILPYQGTTMKSQHCRRPQLALWCRDSFSRPFNLAPLQLACHNLLSCSSQQIHIFISEKQSSLSRVFVCFVYQSLFSFSISAVEQKHKCFPVSLVLLTPLILPC